MKLHVINTGNFKLDGGAMFGVVPKSLWSRTNQPDKNNLCTWAMRSLLIEQGDRLILIDTGIGNKQNEKFFSHFHLHGDETLKKSINNVGFSIDDITDVFLTHLHFDHCGGAVKWANSERTHLEPYFKNAIYWSNKEHWDWAIEPNPREKASFLKENILPLKESGQLQWIKKENTITNSVFKNIDVFFADGHTESQMIPIINYKSEKIVFMADLLPSIGHIPLPYVMSYDTQPLVTLQEKKQFLQEAVMNNYILFLEHDYNYEACTVKYDGYKFKVDKAGKLTDFL